MLQPLRHQRGAAAHHHHQQRQHHVAAAAGQRQPRRRAPRSVPPAAAAAAADAAAILQLPFSDHGGGPKLASRRMPANPLHGLWQAAAAAALRLELAGAALVDRHAAAPFVLAGLVGAMTAAGLDGVTLLAHGLPPYLPDLLMAAAGVWDATALTAVATAVALPLTAWAVRAWWAANLALLSAGPLQQLAQRAAARLAGGAGPESGGSSSSSSSDDGGSHWLAAAAILVRGACLCCIVSSVAQLVGGAAALLPGNAGRLATAAQVAGAVGGAAVAFGLLLAGSRRPAASGGGSGRLLAPLLACELAWLAAMLGLHPLVNAAAGAVVAASLVVLQRAAVLPRLAAYRAAPGDGVTVAVRLSLAGTRPVFDSTPAGQPLQLTAGPVPPAYVELWERASEGRLMQQPDGDAPDADAGAAASSGGDAALPSLRDIVDGLQALADRPEQRWNALAPFVADAAQGLFLGQRARRTLFNPPGVGYAHPGFSWWQPAGDVAAKFGGRVPADGDVFWFPVADGGAAVPTRVGGVGAEHVELDANYGVTNTPLDVEVQLLAIERRPGQPQTH